MEIRNIAKNCTLGGFIIYFFFFFYRTISAIKNFINVDFLVMLITPLNYHAFAKKRKQQTGSTDRLPTYIWAASALLKFASLP